MGSSSTSALGAAASAPAIARRWRSPPESVEHLLDPAAHRRVRHAKVLQHESDVVLDAVDDHLCLGVLADEPDDVCEVARAVRACAAPERAHLTVETPTGRVRYEPVDAAQEGALARTRRADDEQHLTGRDLEVDAV